MNQKPEITGTRYVLAVKALKASGDYYVNQLGFETLWSDEGWHFLKRGKCMVMLTPVSDKPWGQREFAIRTIDGHRITFGEEIET